MQRFDFYQHMLDCQAAARQRGGSGRTDRIRKASHSAPIEDALDYALEMADAVLGHAISDLRERPAIGVELLETF